MYTFLIGSNIDPALLEKAAKISNKIMPKLGVNIVTIKKTIKEINGGLFYTLPDPQPLKSEIHEFDTESHFVLFIGEIFEHSHSYNNAELVLHSFENGGWDAVRKIDGYFSAIFIDKQFGSIQIVSDILGRRLLRYFKSQNVFLISSHDIPIVATGLCPIDFDFDAICSIITIDWPIGGSSLLRKIKVCKSQSVLNWHNNKINTIQKPGFTFRNRLDFKDHKNQKLQVEKIIESLKDNIKFYCKEASSVRLALTGGIDSRALFGALVNSVNTDIITAYTNGYEFDPDVYMAKRVAQRFGVKHVSTLLSTTSQDHFIQNCDVIAFYKNGSSNSKRAMRPLIQYNPNEDLILGGSGGEIYRGYYYPNTKEKTLPLYTLASIYCKKYPRLENLPWSDSKFKLRFKNRVEKTVSYFSTFTNNGYDILDLIYLLERLSHWGEGTWEPHYTRVQSPFFRANLVLAAFQLPSPIGLKSPIHRRIIKQYLGQAFWWPINNKSILPFDNLKGLKGVGSIEKLLCRLFSTLTTYSQRAEKVLTTDGLDVFSQWTGPFKNLIRNILFSKDSIAVEVLEYNKLSEMYDKYCKREDNWTETFGSLITIERWKSMVLRAKEYAKRE